VKTKIKKIPARKGGTDIFISDRKTQPRQSGRPRILGKLKKRSRVGGKGGGDLAVDDEGET